MRKNRSGKDKYVACYAKFAKKKFENFLSKNLFDNIITIKNYKSSKIKNTHFLKDYNFLTLFDDFFQQN